LYLITDTRAGDSFYSLYNIFNVARKKLSRHYLNSNESRATRAGTAAINGFLSCSRSHVCRSNS